MGGRPSVDRMETTADMHAPDGAQFNDPRIVEELKRRDPGFVAVRGVQMIGDGNRRASDGWVFSRVTYVRRDDAPPSG
ncbi:hypothetical protein MINTM005_24050 [Mycobacterium intracellulare]|nr:hypothetical protein MINTM005_24050 [Mycobacterium intracellulare]BCO94265.1 hypothetical protein MINTM016_22410 [Mycobacterium intracellulare]